MRAEGRPTEVVALHRPTRWPRWHGRALQPRVRGPQLCDLLLQRTELFLQLVVQTLLVEDGVLKRADLGRRGGEFDGMLLSDGAQQLVVERARGV